MTPLENELLNEIERLQDEILKLQELVMSEQKKNKKLSDDYEKLQSERTTLYYNDLATNFKQELENILLQHKSDLNKSENNLENLENEQRQIGTTKNELNQLLSTYGAADYNKLQKEYEALQADYEIQQKELEMIKATLSNTLADLETSFHTAYSELNQKLIDEMSQSLESAWREKLKKLLPLVDMKLNES